VIRKPGDLPPLNRHPHARRVTWAGRRRVTSPPSPDDAIAPGSEPADEVTVLVCISCRQADAPAAEPRPGSLLAEDARRAAAGSGVAVRQVGCLGNCRGGCSAAVFRTGCWAYVFGGLTPASGDDLVAGALLFATATDGFMPWRARPEALKRGLVARIPHPDILKELP
jgi:predicted metal-binding protein